MRRILFYTFLALSILYTLGACTTPAALTLNEGDAGKTITLAKGQKLAVTLGGNPSTGYNWAVLPALTGVLNQVGGPEFQGDSKLVGAAGKITLSFEAVSTGQIPLKLVYYRSFEPNVPPIKTFEVTVLVK